MRFVICAVPLLAACNSMLGISDVALESPDAGIDHPMPDATVVPRDCKLDAHFASLVATDSNALAQRSAAGAPMLLVGLNADSSDTFYVQLKDNTGGHGVFGAGGSYPLSQLDASLSSCGICTIGSGDYDSASGTAAQTYVARAAGELSLTTLSATTFAGRVRNLVLRHVTLNSDTKTTTDDPDGCEAAIDDLQFNLTFSTSAGPIAPRAARE